MKRVNRYIWLFISITALIISTACSSSVPVNYPTIELPQLTEGVSTSAVLDDIIEIPPSNAWHKTFEIPPTLEKVKLVGWCVASGGARNDIKVLVMNDINFYNWRNFDNVKSLYQSEKTSFMEISAEISTPGKYHLVISNWFSEFSSKKVTAKVYLYWSVKPVTYTIKAGDTSENTGLQIPAGAQVTFDFADPVDTSNFQITQNGTETAVSANITASKITFIAPAVGDYQFSCGNGTLAVKGKFSVVSAQPIIGEGLTLSSSSANAPPHLDKIANQTYNNPAEMAGKQIVIDGGDPDGDTLNYYAFNIPMVVSGYDSDGRRIWSPAATLDTNTGVFTWNELSKDLTPGKYFLRFEVSDGILSDSQDVVVEIK